MTGPLKNKEQLAAFLGVPVSWVRDAITARSIPISWVGRHARFSDEDVAAIVAAGKEAPATAPTPLRLVTGPRPPAGPAPPPRPAGPSTPSKSRTA